MAANATAITRDHRTGRYVTAVDEVAVPRTQSITKEAPDHVS